VVDKAFLRHNFDIPSSVHLYFPDACSGAIHEANSKDLCIYKRMLLANLHFPFQGNARELLCYLRLTSFHIMPNG